MNNPIVNPLSLALILAFAVSTGCSSGRGPSQGLTGLANITGATAPTGAAVHTVGDAYQGGIVFYVDATGQHGLIATRADQGSGIQWHNGNYKIISTTDDGLGAGAKNTEIQASAQVGDNQADSYAATIAANYSVQEDGKTACTGAGSERCYNDWYLPSKAELSLLYSKQSIVGGFVNAGYWSSTENANGYAWLQYFDDHYHNKYYRINVFAIRAIRTF
jgi:hypothetical protein